MFFDSAPVIAVTDAAILSRVVDATILVIDHNGATREEAAFALEQLRKVQANVIGAIINNFPNKRSYYHYYSYYYGDKNIRKRKRVELRRRLQNKIEI